MLFILIYLCLPKLSNAESAPKKDLTAVSLNYNDNVLVKKKSAFGLPPKLNVTLSSSDAVLPAASGTKVLRYSFRTAPAASLFDTRRFFTHSFYP